MAPQSHDPELSVSKWRTDGISQPEGTNMALPLKLWRKSSQVSKSEMTWGGTVIQWEPVWWSNGWRDRRKALPAGIISTQKLRKPWRISIRFRCCLGDVRKDWMRRIALCILSGGKWALRLVQSSSIPKKWGLELGLCFFPGQRECQAGHPWSVCFPFCGLQGRDPFQCPKIIEIIYNVIKKAMASEIFWKIWELEELPMGRKASTYNLLSNWTPRRGNLTETKARGGKWIWCPFWTVRV